MIRSKKAQSIIEVAFITIAVMTGLFLTWQFVVPSVGGYFKQMDVTAQESENDPFKQTPPGTGPGPNCQVGNWINTGLCGGGCPYAGHTNQCPVFDMLQQRVISGVDCPPNLAVTRCVNDESCCTCWGAPCNFGAATPTCCGHNVQDMNGTGTWPPNSANPFFQNSCVDGQAKEERTCGLFTARLERQCVPEPGNRCDIICSGPQGNGTKICPQTIWTEPVFDNERLTDRFVNWQLAGAGETSCTNRRCETHCGPGTIPDIPNNRCVTCTGAINLRVPPHRIFGNRYRWVEDIITADSSTFDLRGIPAIVAFNRNNISRIDYSVTEITHYGHTPAPVTQCSDNPVADNPATNPYYVCHVNFRAPWYQGTVVVNDPYQNYSNMKSTTNPNNCNPSYIWSRLSWVNNHSESFAAKALWSGNTLTGIMIESCSPDTNGSVGFDEADITISIFLSSCGP